MKYKPFFLPQYFFADFLGMLVFYYTFIYTHPPLDSLHVLRCICELKRTTCKSYNVTLDFIYQLSIHLND